MPRPRSDAPAPPATPAQEPRRRRRSAEAQAEFRQQVLERAKAMYREAGHEGLSMRAIAAALGISPMALYSYFPSRHALLKQVWVDFFKELLARLLEAGVGRRSPHEVLRASVCAFIDYWEAHPDRYRMVYANAGAAADGADIDYGDDPVYGQVIALQRERMVACAPHARPWPEKTVQQLRELTFLKMIGYLQTTIAVRRYAISGRASLRRAVVDDIMRMVEAAAG